MKKSASRRQPPRVTFRTVRALALALPGVSEGTTYGTPALKYRGQMFACLAAHRSAEPNTLIVRMDVEQRDALIDEDPGTYYLTDHYVGHPCVLVRLSRVHRDALPDLLSGGWRWVAARPLRGGRKTT